MAGTIRPPEFHSWGDEGPRIYLSTDGNPPSHAGDGTFRIGDWIINTIPTAAGVAFWVCTTAGAGDVAVFKGVATAA